MNQYISSRAYGKTRKVMLARGYSKLSFKDHHINSSLKGNGN